MPELQLEWVTIPASPARLGTDEAGASANSKPAHEVDVAAFQIARAPVTVADFARFAHATGYLTDAEREGWSAVWTGQAPDDIWPDNDLLWQRIAGASWRSPRGTDDVRHKARHPVTHLSYADATAFCDWIGARLPTEKEWEKAARGPDGRRNPWGEGPPAAGDCNCSMRVSDTTPVGAHPGATSPYGLLDAVGNVWEWTASRYQAYPYADSADPAAMRLPADLLDAMLAEFATHPGVEEMVAGMQETGELRPAFRDLMAGMDLAVIRGGSFYMNCEAPETVRVTARVYALRDYRCFDLGLRPARDP